MHSFSKNNEYLNSKKIKIQLIGTFLLYKEVEIDPMEYDYFNSVAKRINLSFPTALLDSYFYLKLRLENTKTMMI
jgi:hypothetical protein